MNHLLVALPLILSLPLLAQDTTTTRDVPADGKIVPQHSSGLRGATNGDGLLGAGTDYRVHLRTAGRRFEPALGRAVPTTQHLALSPMAVQHGLVTVAQLPSFAPPVQTERMARYEHAPGVSECYDVRPEGVELSWRFEHPLPGDGDLVVRYAVDTSLPAPVAAAGGLEWKHPEFGGVKLGGVTGVDALGTKVAGSMRCVDGALEFSLPAAFVAAATYPIVLDPLIGTTFGISVGLTYADAQPDVAYESSPDRFFVVWLRTFSATDVDVRGQLVSGSTMIAMSLFSSTGVASHPRVANLGSHYRFGVVWTQQVGSTSSVEFNAIHSTTGVAQAGLTLASSTTDTYLDADIGGETDAAPGTSRGFVVTYEDNALDAIRAQRIWRNLANNWQTANAISVFADTLLNSTYVKPAISRTAAADGNFLVVAQRNTFIGSPAIVAKVVSSMAVAGPTVTVYGNSAYDVRAPDVDGYANKWVVAWEQENTSLPYPAVVVAPVSLNGAGTALVVGNSSSIGGTSLARASLPSVGYTPGKTWLGYHNLSTLPFQPAASSLRARGIDSDTCTLGSDLFSLPTSGTESRIVVATKTSSGLTSGEEALAVMEDSFDDVIAQQLKNHSNGGSIVNLGGGCGSSGTQIFSHNPAIGSSGLVCSVDALPATALVTIFNLAPTGVGLPCGACVWTPFSVTLSPPIVGASASVEFPIPYLASLAGSMFETQWTTLDITQAPCPVFPGFVLSNRSQLTIGL